MLLKVSASLSPPEVSDGVGGRGKKRLMDFPGVRKLFSGPLSRKEIKRKTTGDIKILSVDRILTIP